MRDILLAAGIALSTASQLRIPSLALGPGDISIAMWIGFTILTIAMGKVRPHRAALLTFIVFWSVFAFAQSVGACVGYMTDDKLNFPDVLHDSVAYLLMAAMTCLAAATTPVNSLPRIEWLLVAFSTLGLTVQVLAGWGVLPPYAFDPWYWDRFRGWSENPNQLALFCAIITLLSLHLAAQSKTGPRLLALLCAAVALVAGRLTKSDTFLIAMLVSGLVLVVLRVHDWMTIRDNVVSLRYAAALCIALSIVPLGLSLTPYVFADSLSMERFALSFSKEQGRQATEKTANLRLHLWNDALSRGVRAGALGLGPGPHLDRPEGVRSLPDPFEAHSTVLDTFLQAGLLGVFALVWIVGSAGVAAYVAKTNTLVALVGAIVVFGIPHLIIRHPIVWIALAICFLSKPQTASRPSLAQTR